VDNSNQFSLVGLQLKISLKFIRNGLLATSVSRTLIPSKYYDKYLLIPFWKSARENCDKSPPFRGKFVFGFSSTTSPLNTIYDPLFLPSRTFKTNTKQIINYTLRRIVVPRITSLYKTEPV